MLKFTKIPSIKVDYNTVKSGHLRQNIVATQINITNNAVNNKLYPNKKATKTTNLILGQETVTSVLRIYREV